MLNGLFYQSTLANHSCIPRHFVRTSHVHDVRATERSQTYLHRPQMRYVSTLLGQCPGTKDQSGSIKGKIELLHGEIGTDSPRELTQPGSPIYNWQCPNIMKAMSNRPNRAQLLRLTRCTHVRCYMQIKKELFSKKTLPRFLGLWTNDATGGRPRGLR